MKASHSGDSKLHVSMFGGEDDALFDEAGALTGEGAVVLSEPFAEVCSGRWAFTVLAHRPQVAAFGAGCPLPAGEEEPVVQVGRAELYGEASVSNGNFFFGGCFPKGAPVGLEEIGVSRLRPPERIECRALEYSPETTDGDGERFGGRSWIEFADYAVVEEPFGVGSALTKTARQGGQSPANNVKGPAPLTGDVLDGQQCPEEIGLKILHFVNHQSETCSGFPH